MFAKQAYQHPREELIEGMERIYRYRMTTTSGGNLSICEANGRLWITPASIDKGSLRREDIVCVQPDGSIEGLHRPSSELPIHQQIRALRPELRGIAHAHPTALVAFSLVHQMPNTRLFHQAHKTCGSVGFAPYACPGTDKLGDHVAEAFGKGYDCVILENHGVVTGGSSFQQAFQRFETLEFTARILIKAHELGNGIHFLSDEELAAEEARDLNFASFVPDEPSGDENELRRVLAAFVRRAYRQRLFISTQGSYSARVDGHSFLITPHGCDRGRIEAQDLVLVRDGQVEEGKQPSRAVRTHGSVYDMHPEVNSVVNAYPVNATAFSVSGYEFDSRTIPESYIVIRNVGRAPYGMQYRDSQALAAMLEPTRPSLILENDGVLVTGKSVLEVFDRLEVLEATADAIINARKLGTLHPLDAEITRELDRNYFGL